MVKRKPNESRGTEILERIKVEKKFNVFNKLLAQIVSDLDRWKPEYTIVMLWVAIERILSVCKGKNWVISNWGVDKWKVDRKILMEILNHHCEQVMCELRDEDVVDKKDINYVG